MGNVNKTLFTHDLIKNIVFGIDQFSLNILTHYKDLIQQMNFSKLIGKHEKEKKNSES